MYTLHSSTETFFVIHLLVFRRVLLGVKTNEKVINEAKDIKQS